MLTQPTSPENKPHEPELTIDFARDVLPIFQQNCAVNGCHGEQNAQVGLKLTTHANILAGSEAGEAVIPFAPEQSLLIEMVTGKGLPQMPLNSPALSAGQIDTLRQWIREGARDEAGRIPHQTPGPRLLIPNRGDALISIVHLELLTVSRLIPVTEDSTQTTFPSAVTGDAENWFVALRGVNEIRRYDILENTRKATARLPRPPFQLALAAGKLFVTHDRDPSGPLDQITALDPVSLATAAVLQVEAEPVALAAGNDDTRLYVACRTADWISVIDAQAAAVISGFPLEPGNPPAQVGVHKPVSLALSTDGQTLWVSCEGSNQVRVYGAADGTLLAQVGVQAGPGQIAMAPDGSRAYIPNRRTDRVTAIDTGTLSIAASLRFFGMATPTGCAVSPDGALLFVSSTNENGRYIPRRVPGRRGNVAIFDLQTQRLVKVLEVEHDPGWLALTR